MTLSWSVTSCGSPQKIQPSPSGGGFLFTRSKLGVLRQPVEVFIFYLEHGCARAMLAGFG